MAKAGSWTLTDAEARRPGERKGLDTPVVLAVNGARSVSYTHLDVYKRQCGDRAMTVRLLSFWSSRPFTNPLAVISPTILLTDG